MEFKNYMETKLYKLYGLEVAIHLLRPNATWQVTNSKFTQWDDPRPCPSWEEVVWVMDKIKQFEDSIPTIWLQEDLDKMKQSAEQYQNTNMYTTSVGED